MDIKPIVRRNVSDEVLEQIKSQIISGNWKSGSKIPGEMELTGLFNVSRVSVREAIHRLVGMGVLTVRRGEGTFVTEMLPSNYFSSLLPVLMIEGGNLPEILEFRSIVEVQSAGLAAIRADDEDLRRMEGIIESMEKKDGDYREFAREDLNFHSAVALASHNRVIVKVNAIIHDMMKVAMEKIVNTTGFQGGLYFHKRILKAIREKDRDKAMEIMQAHIDVTIEKMNKD